jgi:diadenosine tetraphosphate (Ap4A) HIT family hydrolase
MAELELSQLTLSNCVLCEKIANLNDPEFLGSCGGLLYFRGPFRDKWPGHLTLIWCHHVEEMSDLTPIEWAHVSKEFIKAELAIRSFVGVSRINFVKFGNVCHHLHWHLIPRYDSEIYQDKSPWELLDVDMIHQGPLPADPYSVFISAMQL